MTNKTIGFFIASIVSIALSIIVAAQIERPLRKGQRDMEKALQTDTKQTRHIAIADSIQTFHVILPEQDAEPFARVQLDIQFHQSNENESDNVEIEYDAILGSDKSFAVDLSKMTWDKSGEVLTLYLNDSMEIGEYHAPMLHITLPHRDWRIKGIDKLGGNTDIFNEYAPISLDAEVYEVSLSGKFKQLNVWRAGDGYCFNCINIRNTALDSLDLFFGARGAQSIIGWDGKVSFNSVNLHMDTHNSIDVEDLSTLSKMRWFALTEADKKRLGITENQSEEDNGSIDSETVPDK